MTSEIELSTGQDSVIETEENQLTLREISESLPDTSLIMQSVGHCWWHFIYAARGGNWDLAGYYLRRLNKLGERLKVLRPKHRDLFAKFQANALPAVIAAVDARDLAALETAYETATDYANRMHVEAKYPYVRWVLPPEAPQGLDLGPTGTA